MSAAILLKPRELTWRGVVRAEAFWFSRHVVSEEEARRRILSLWRPGARVEEYPTGWLLRLAEAVRVVCREAPGLPLVSQNGVLTAAPMPVTKLHEWKLSAGSVLLVSGGEVEKPEGGEAIDISRWIDPGDWEMPRVRPLGFPPPPAALLPPVATDARQQLGLPAADGELAAVMRALYEPEAPRQNSWRAIGAFFTHIFSAPGLWEVPGTAQKLRPLAAIVGAGMAALLIASLSLQVIQSAFLLWLGLAAAGAVGWFFPWGIRIPRPQWLSNFLSGLNLHRVRRKRSAGPAVAFEVPGGCLRLASTVRGVAIAYFLLVLVRYGGAAILANSTALLIFTLLLVGLLFLIVFPPGLSLLFGTTATGSSGAGLPVQLVAGMRGLWSGAVGWISSALALMRHRRQAPADDGNQSLPRTPATHRDSWTRRLAAALSRLTLRSRLGKLIGRRQAAYVAEMMEMFERGQWDEALRHAIPLREGTDGQTSRPALGVPKPLSTIEIKPERGPGGSSLQLQGLDLHLRPLYRRSFERLKELGRFKEAAYVLAELLDAGEEAVSFLEQHGELRLAAEIAEARDLPPGLVVRQWFVAKDRDRAIRYARLHGAFEDAVLRLEKGNRQREAEALRLLWCDALAKAGDYENAYLQARNIAAFAALAQEWLRLGIEGGGLPAARLLAHQLANPLTEWPEIKPAVLQLLEDNTPEGARARAEFVPLLSSTRSTAGQIAARAAIRACWRDLQSGFTSPKALKLGNLIRIADDAALKADLPKVEPLPGFDFLGSDKVIRISCEKNDRGTWPVYDVVGLPDGTCLAALGEAGVRWLGRDGGLRAHFDQPAYQIILSEVGHSAILLARRGEAVRLARLDLASRKVAFWHETMLGSWAGQYDGSLWFVSLRGRIVAVDVLAAEFGQMWDSGPLPGEVLKLHWNPAPSRVEWRPGSLSYLTALVQSRPAEPLRNPDSPLAAEWWQIDVPQLVLRTRTALPSTEDDPDLENVVLHDFGGDSSHPPLAGVGLFYGEDGTEPTPHLNMMGGSIDLKLKAPDRRVLKPITGGISWALVPEVYAEVLVCKLIHLPTRRIKVRFELRGAQRVSARFSSHTLVLADDLGRVLSFDLELGKLLREWRVR